MIKNKFFIKKSNYSSDLIKMIDFSLIGNKNKIFLSDDSLIRPEYNDIYREKDQIVFSSEASIWSFFSIKFYLP